jgi:Sap-like sulfolipid-1-addressing protein
MSEALPGLLVLAIGGSVAPPLLLLTILFLGSRRPLPNATVLALGYFATCAVIGVSGLILFGGAGSAVSAVGRVISTTVGALLVILGLRSLLGSPDPDASPPGWMESIDSMSPPKAFGIGMALFPLQIKNLAIFIACLNLIITSGLSPRDSIAALGLVLLVFAIPVLALIGLSATVPLRASTILESLRRWMGKHNRAITVVLCLVFGAFFFVGGLWGA